MSACIPNPFLTVIPAARGRIVSLPDGSSSGAFRLSADSIGMHTLTLTNVAVGSRVAIRDQAGTTTFYDQIAAAETVVIPLPVYSSGSLLNNWRVKVRKASGMPFYQPYETLMTAFTGSSSIYVNQLPDQR